MVPGSVSILLQIYFACNRNYPETFSELKNLYEILKITPL